MKRIFFFLLFLFLLSGYNDVDSQSLKNFIKPAIRNAGFKMPGYILWCPSVIKVGKTYHMFASRWPEQYGLGGWTKYSEIVRATSNNLYGPYAFKEVVIQKREGHWDNDRAHNPKIVKSGKTYVLYYISSANETGYAWSHSIEGPWTRVDSVAMHFSNPAPLVEKDGSIYVFGRKSVNDIRIAQGATAPSFDSHYTILNEGKNLLPGNNQLEDPTIWKTGKQYNILLSDFRADATGIGKAGAQYYSTDGIHYDLVSGEPVYTKRVEYDDGTADTFKRRERPFVYADEKGKIKALFTACLTDKEQSWIVVNPVADYLAADFDKNPGKKFQSLFNGKDLKGWNSFLKTKGKNNDPDTIFSVIDGLLHISGKEFGYIVTEKTYSNFHLIAEFKWGEKKYPPRENRVRDNGILYFVVPEDKVWPRAIECQVEEGDCGDFWLIDSVTVVYDGVRTQPTKNTRLIKKKDNEKPTGEWNTIEIIVKDGKCTHIVNGSVVNEAEQPSINSGRILIQSEGAETWYRKIDIREL